MHISQSGARRRFSVALPARRVVVLLLLFSALLVPTAPASADHTGNLTQVTYDANDQVLPNNHPVFPWVRSGSGGVTLLADGRLFFHDTSATAPVYQRNEPALQPGATWSMEFRANYESGSLWFAGLSELDGRFAGLCFVNNTVTNCGSLFGRPNVVITDNGAGVDPRGEWHWRVEKYGMSHVAIYQDGHQVYEAAYDQLPVATTRQGAAFFGAGASTTASVFLQYFRYQVLEPLDVVYSADTLPNLDPSTPWTDSGGCGSPFASGCVTGGVSLSGGNLLFRDTSSLISIYTRNVAALHVGASWTMEFLANYQSGSLWMAAMSELNGRWVGICFRNATVNDCGALGVTTSSPRIVIPGVDPRGWHVWRVEKDGLNEARIYMDNQLVRAVPYSQLPVATARKGVVDFGAHGTAETATLDLDYLFYSIGPLPDRTPPLVTPPANLTAEATSAAGAVVTYPPATATDAVGVVSGPSCSPASGSTFALGTTTVTCSASDAAGNTGTATFTVTVSTVRFFLSPGPNASGDLAWQTAVGSFTEFDLNGLANGQLVRSLSAGPTTITVGPATAGQEVFCCFGGLGGGVYGTVEGRVLLNRSGGNWTNGFTFEFSQPVSGFGLWIFDDGSGLTNQFTMTVIEVGGGSATSAALDANPGSTAHTVEGFLGATSTAGITSVTILGDPNVGGGVFEVDHLQVAVFNRAPTAAAGSGYTVAEGGSVVLDGAGSTDPDGNTLAYSWDLDNNGTFETPGQASTFSAARRDGPGSQTVVLQVCDPAGACATNSTSVTITNVPPTLTLSGPDSVDEGAAYTLTLSARDPGVDTISGWTIAWGDGTTETLAGNPTTAPHTYPDGPRNVTITATAADEDGTYSAGNSLAVNVRNVPPILTLSGPESVDEGTAYTLGLRARDPGADTISGWTIAWGDGTTETLAGNPTTANHTYADGPRNVTITATATDEDGTYPAGNSVAVNVRNVPPRVNPPSANPEPSEEASAARASATFVDPGTADGPFSCTVNYGDGSGDLAGTVTGASCAGPAHTYADNRPGGAPYTVTVSVTDKDGGMGTATSPHVVLNVAPTATFVVPAGSFSEGDTFTLSLTGPSDVSPFDLAAGFTYAFDCGSAFSAASAASSATCLALDNPSAAVRGKVIDKDGGVSEYPGTVAITNVAPTVGAIVGPTDPVPVGEIFTLSANFTDPGVRDTHTAAWDWGDGTTSTGTVSEASGAGTASGSHAYSGAGRYTATLTVTDKDGGFGRSTYVIRSIGPPGGLPPSVPPGVPPLAPVTPPGPPISPPGRP